MWPLTLGVLLGLQGADPIYQLCKHAKVLTVRLQ